MVALSRPAALATIEDAGAIVRACLAGGAGAHPAEILRVIEKEAPGVLQDRTAAARLMIELASIAAAGCHHEGDPRGSRLVLNAAIARRVDGLLLAAGNGHIARGSR